jgi:glycosyltransferase involved in cell wall biosynthesis
MRRKNQAFLISAFRDYVERGGVGRLLIVGAATDPAYNDECLAAAAGMSDRVVFTGAVDQPSLLRLLATARAWLSTSLRETSSIALSEALAANCSVLSLDVGTASEQVVGGAGIVLPVVATPRDVSDALFRLRAGGTTDARTRAMAQHPEAVASRTLGIYEELVSE